MNTKIIAAVLAIVATAAHIVGQTPPEDRIVVILDNSGTYKLRREAALAKTKELLESISKIKIRRWDKARVTISVISLDAVPEVIWDGDLARLKTTDTKDWIKRFDSRTDYAQCTDVDAAFRLAARLLTGDPKYVDKYVFAFSDLIHEPPTDSIRKCRTPAKPSVPTEQFPWDALNDISVSVMWVPPEQKLAWKRAVTEHGLDQTFSLYTTSESDAVQPPPPAKPELTVNEEERAAVRSAYVEKVYTVVRWIGIAAAAAIAGLIGLYIFGRVRRSRHRSANAVGRQRSIARGQAGRNI